MEKKKKKKDQQFFAVAYYINKGSQPQVVGRKIDTGNWEKIEWKDYETLKQVTRRLWKPWTKTNKPRPQHRLDLVLVTVLLQIVRMIR